MTDGTVTDVLEAYAGEPIKVVKLSQALAPPDSLTPELELTGDTSVLRRTVLLQGAASGLTYLHADSVIAPERLHPEVLGGLLDSEKPVGRLLAQHRIETFREIVAIGFEPAGRCAAYFGLDSAAKLVFRTYRIIVGGLPVMRITEKFPVSAFAPELEIQPAAGPGHATAASLVAGSDG
jgi:chorismate-pyruvate lyase